MGKRIIPVLVVLIGGCAKPWRPPIDTVQRENLPSVFALADYAPDEPGWRWVYRRTRNGAEPNAFVREFTDRTYVDGAMVGRSFQPLLTYLPDRPGEDGPTERSDQRALPVKRRPRPSAPLDGEFGVILAFDPPLPPLPVHIRMDEPVSANARLRCYDEDGDYLYDGTARRSVLLEGLEDVRAGQADYARCLRLQVTTRFHLYWGPVFDLVQYLWLARGVGEVRRIEHVTGWVLLLPFSATDRFELIDYRSPPTRTSRPGGPYPVFRRWARMAIELAQALPSPQIGGMRIELTGRDEFLADTPTRCRWARVAAP